MARAIARTSPRRTAATRSLGEEVTAVTLASGPAASKAWRSGPAPVLDSALSPSDLGGLPCATRTLPHASLPSVSDRLLPGPGRASRARMGGLLRRPRRPSSPPRPRAVAEDASLQQAREILKQVPLVDGHNDTPWLIREAAGGDVAKYDLRKRTPHETDLARLREGQVGAQFWSVWIPSVDSGSARMQLEQIDIARRMIAAYPEALVFATKAADVEAAHRAGKIASFLGMENGRALENSLGPLRAYYDLGVRYMTLTHGRNTDWADSATDEAKHSGLSPFGKEVVREMNRLGMLVDISHVSPGRDAPGARRLGGARSSSPTPAPGPSPTTRATCPTTCCGAWPRTGAWS